MRNNPLDLYAYADERGIDVDWFPLSVTKSLSLPLPDGSCAIAIDPWKQSTLPEETVCMAHELGHCETGSFYNSRAAMDIRQKHENRADKWAIRRLVPKTELDAAVRSGYTDLWSLADNFGVTPEFMRKALCWYTHGNLAVKEYM